MGHSIGVAFSKQQHGTFIHFHGLLIQCSLYLCRGLALLPRFLQYNLKGGKAAADHNLGIPIGKHIHGSLKHSPGSLVPRSLNLRHSLQLGVGSRALSPLPRCFQHGLERGKIAVGPSISVDWCKHVHGLLDNFRGSLIQRSLHLRRSPQRGVSQCDQSLMPRFSPHDQK